MPKRFVVRGSRTHKALVAIREAGGSMPVREFRRVVRELCPTKEAAFELQRRMREHGYLEPTIRLTATGSVHAAAADDRPKTPGKRQ